MSREVVDDRAARRVVLRIATRRAARSALFWGLAFAAMVAAVASSYATVFPTAASRAALERGFATNAGFAALYGRARHIDTVAGFTAWRLGALVWLGAIWALLLSTRLTRGEEDAGRWELFLAGRTTRRAAAAHTVVAYAVGVAILWALTGAAAVAIGTKADVRFGVAGALFFALAMASGAVQFLAVGFFTAQLSATRRQANTLAALVLGVAFLLRVVADVDASLGWVRWTTPFGWVENLHPFTGSDLVPLVPIAVFTLTLVVAGLALAGRRDLDAGLLAAHDRSDPHTTLLRNPLTLTFRLVRPVALAWLIGMAVCGVVFGLVAQSASKAATGSKTLENALARLGGHHTGAATFLGLMFLFAAGFLGLAAASQVNATRTEEAEGYVDHLLVRPVERARWLAGRVGVGAAFVVVSGVVVGAFAWMGAATQHSGVSFPRMVEAGANVAPPSLFVLGMGMLAFGFFPRRATVVAYGIVAWSFFVEIVAVVVKSNRLLLDSSVLTHMSPVPAADFRWSAAAWLVGLGLLAAVVGVLRFRTRDLAGQ